MSVPPVERDVQHGSGVHINIHDSKSDDDEETDDEMDTDDNEDKPHDILVKIGFHHDTLIYLRKQYRDSLPQLREQEGEEMETFLRVYADTKVQIILDQDGLEGGISIPEENTEDENEDDDDGGDDDDDDPEEDSEHTKESGANNEDEDNACEECKKEQLFDFVFEAEEFLNPEYKEMMEEYVEECKNE